MASETEKLGRYELLECIARGGMGEIYLAKTRGAGGFEKTVIIKTILPHLAEEEEFIEKFLDEGRTVVQLVHGNIVPVFDMGQEDGRYFIAMEYIAGRDLREIVKRLEVKRQLMPVDLALYVASEALKGLHYAHQKTGQDGKTLGIIHRDISPSNILLSAEGDVKIIDFGIARAATRLSKTATGRLQGKFSYMSPEQASGKKLSPRSDVFSLGVSLYEMLTGFRPFEGQTDLESLDLVRKCEVDPPSTLNPEIPEEIDGILAHALALDPNERFESAEKMQVELLQYLYSSGSAPTGSDAAEFLSELFPEGLERKELRLARGSGSEQKMVSLDNALDAEIDRLLGATNDIDPRATTAISQGVKPESHTSTQFQGPTQDSVPSIVSVVGPAPAVGSKRYFTGAIAIGVLIGALAMIWGSTSEDSLIPVRVQSDPSGATVWVDGARVVDAVTPYTMELEVGPHQLRLELEDHDPLVLNVSIHDGDREKIIDPSSGAVLKLSQKPRAFSVFVSPANATLYRNNIELGVSPQSFELAPGDVANLRATAKGCRSANYTLAYSHKNSEVVLDLDCGDQANLVLPAAKPKPKPKPKDPSVAIRLMFDSKPPGARVTLNGKDVGTAPVERMFLPNEEVRVEMVLPGYETTSRAARAKSLRRRTVLTLKAHPEGCLNVSLVSPQIAQVVVDGRELGQVSRVKRGIKIGAGPHTVSATNKAAGKKDTKKVIVEAGSTCATVVLFEN